MKIGDLAPRELSNRLLRDGIRVGMGPFAVSVRTDIPDVANHMMQMYAHHADLTSAEFSDFHVQIRRSGGPRRWIGRQALFLLDGDTPFKPLPIEQAYPMLEWGLNWCISSFAHQYLILHAAVVERNARAVIMPGEPGAGKSTLCAALVSRGWRLLSDELALLCMETGKLIPLARPINLKNASIPLVKKLSRDNVLTRSFLDTSKGTVALMRPPEDSVLRAREAALPSWIVAPRYQAGAGCVLGRCSRAQMLMRLADLSFNYSLLGLPAFELLADLVEQAPSLELNYDDLDRAISELESLTDSD